jgi:hypothetical protein
MKMLVTRRKLEQSVSVRKATIAIRIHVGERAAHENVTLSDVGGGYREADHRMSPGGYAPFLNAAEVCREIFHSRDPVVLRCLAVDDEIRKGGSVDGVLNE